MSDLLDFIETESRANAAFHITNADNLTKESNTLLNLVLAGGGGALALAAGLLQKITPVPRWQIAAVSAAAGYLFLLAGLIIWRCLWVQDIWPPSNEPKNFPLTGYSVDELPGFDLENQQGRIGKNRTRNEVVGTWLNKCRALAAPTPIVTALAAIAAVMAA